MNEYVGAGLARIDGRLDPRVRFLGVHGLLAAGVAAAFRRHLVFDHHAGESCARIAATPLPDGGIQGESPAFQVDSRGLAGSRGDPHP